MIHPVFVAMSLVVVECSFVLVFWLWTKFQRGINFSENHFFREVFSYHTELIPNVWHR